MGHPPRILHVIDSLQSGGAERYLATVVPELTRSGRAEAVVLVGGSGGANPAFVEALREHSLAFSFVEARALYDPRLLRAELHAARRFRVDVVHAHLDLSITTSRFVAAALRKPHVATVHLAPFPLTQDARRQVFADGLTARLSTRVVGVSPQTVDVYSRAFLVPRSRRRVILTVPEDRRPPAGFDRAALRRELAGGDDALVVLAACRLERHKGIADLVEAAAALRDRLPRLRVLVAGRGPDEERLRDLVAERDLADTVRLLGYREDIGALLAASDVFCLPSHHEGLPVSILEAMQAGVPVVATAAGGTGHVVRDGETGLLLQPGAVADLAAALERMLTDAPLRERVTTAARALVEASCSRAAVAAQHADLYDELVAAGRRG